MIVWILLLRKPPCLRCLSLKGKSSSGSRHVFRRPFLWRSHGHTHTSQRQTFQAWPCRAREMRTWWHHCLPLGCVVDLHWIPFKYFQEDEIPTIIIQDNFIKISATWFSPNIFLNHIRPKLVQWEGVGKWFAVRYNMNMHSINIVECHLVDWMEKFSLTSPIENLWPSMVQRLTPHLEGSPLASWGM